MMLRGGDLAVTAAWRQRLQPYWVVRSSYINEVAPRYSMEQNTRKTSGIGRFHGEARGQPFAVAAVKR